MYVQFHNVCTTILLFKPRGPESGGREAVTQREREVGEVREASK